MFCTIGNPTDSTGTQTTYSAKEALSPLQAKERRLHHSDPPNTTIPVKVISYGGGRKVLHFLLNMAICRHRIAFMLEVVSGDPHGSVFVGEQVKPPAE